MLYLALVISFVYNFTCIVILYKLSSKDFENNYAYCMSVWLFEEFVKNLLR